MANFLLVERYHLLPNTMSDRLSGAGLSPTNMNLGTSVPNTSSWLARVAHLGPEDLLFAREAA